MSENTGAGWSSEEKEQLVQDYLAAEPTPETTMEIVTTLAESYGKTVNGVRMVLTQGGHYIKKAAATTAKKKTGTRIVKADAIEKLNDVIAVATEEPADEAITARLTGKAAKYFTDIIIAVAKNAEETD